MSSAPSLLEIQEALYRGIINTLPKKNFCITGKTSVTRAKMEELILMLGGRIDKGVYGSTDYLITPNNSANVRSTKHRDAIEKGVTIVSEEWLVNQILGVDNE